MFSFDTMGVSCPEPRLRAKHKIHTWALVNTDNNKTNNDYNRRKIDQKCSVLQTQWHYKRLVSAQESGYNSNAFSDG